MKALIVHDTRGNHSTYTLMLPDSMQRWRVSSFLAFLRAGNDDLQDEGYLAAPLDPVRMESLRRLVLSPETTLNRPVRFVQNEAHLGPDDHFDLPAAENIVTLERQSDAPVPLADSRISVAERNKAAFSSCGDHITNSIDALFDFSVHRISRRNRQRVTSFSDLTDNFAQSLDQTNQLRVIYRLAMLLHAGQFENISKLLDGVDFRTGPEMWGNLARGYGGVCSEKTGALKFVCDVLDIPNRPVLGTLSPIPSDFRDTLFRYVDSGGENEVPLWIQHHMLEVAIGNERYLVDGTNGNIPLVFLDSADADRLIAGGMRARMVYSSERLNLKRFDNETGDILLTLSEFHVPGLQMKYVFEQGLGLQISSDLYLGVYFDWGGERSAQQQAHYSSLARRVGFPYPRFIHAENLASVPDEGLRGVLHKLMAILRRRHDDPHYTGDFTFVIQPILPHFWSIPRVSPSVSAHVASWQAIPETEERNS